MLDLRGIEMAAGDKALVQAKYPEAKAVKAVFGYQIMSNSDCLAYADNAAMAWKVARANMWRAEYRQAKQAKQAK